MTNSYIIQKLHEQRIYEYTFYTGKDVKRRSLVRKYPNDVRVEKDVCLRDLTEDYRKNM